MRLSLLLVALVPPLVAIGVMYLYTSHQVRQDELARADRAVVKFRRFQSGEDQQLRAVLEQLAENPVIRRAALQLTADPSRMTSLDPLPSSIDFLELIDKVGHVRASANRPGLVGRQMTVPFGRFGVFATVEYDLSGPHAARAVIVELTDSLFLYGGRFVGDDDRRAIEEITDGDVRIVFAKSRDDTFGSMTPLALYDRGESVESLLAGSNEAGYYIVASFPLSSGESGSSSLLTVIGLVSLFSVVGALAIGWYLTGRAKREVDNLIEASERVARGDFVTPVMAYEEGEFAQLADSFSEMMGNLRQAQRDLATAEKIAAWEAVGRKIAHEVKNPLTPISISVDDLRRSYEDKLPNFDKTLAETTSTIKSELNRLTRLLDEFVAFARMTPPKMRSVTVGELVEPLHTLYRRDIDSGRLVVRAASASEAVLVDPDNVRQLLVNLIKNGLEAGSESVVSIDMGCDEKSLVITVNDSGPGFPDSMLSGDLEPQVSSKAGGFGLGLVICQRIVFDHGGEMRLSNNKDAGARIEIILPRSHGEDTGYR